jgi:LEA14-like dessication related protein
MVDPEFEDVENFKLGKVNWEMTTVSADIRLRNPNRFGLHLKTIACDVYMDSTHLGYFENSSDIKIPREASFGLPVNGEVQTLKLMDYSKKALFGEPAYIRVNGHARVGRFGIYRTVPFEYRDTIKIKL